MGSLTVMETLQFSAALYSGASSIERHRDIGIVLDQMGLRSCANTRVGNIFFKGLSGGQQRRLSIGIELLAKSPALLLDEPTSGKFCNPKYNKLQSHIPWVNTHELRYLFLGLDSAASFGVMRVLEKLAKRGHTIIATLHQPNSDVWSTLDQVLILCNGGRPCFLGAAYKVSSHFKTLGQPCPAGYNPAGVYHPSVQKPI